jgi:hypothetical protein
MRRYGFLSGPCPVFPPVVGLQSLMHGSINPSADIGLRVVRPEGFQELFDVTVNFQL